MKNEKTTSHFIYSIFDDKKRRRERKVFIKVSGHFFKDVKIEYTSLSRVPNLKNFYLLLESEEF